MDEKHHFLVETCLLTHGLRSVTDEMLLEAWPKELNCIAWIDRGEVRIGNMEDYIPFRRQAAEVKRINCNTYADALMNGVSGALTASGTMGVCEELGIPLAVTCGMGGLSAIRKEALCPDLPALAQMPVSLISAGPKDLVDVNGTIDWLQEHGVQVLGANCDRYTGYIFRSTDVPLSGKLGNVLPQPPGKLLIINPIPEADRIQDLSLLQQGIDAGREAEIRGGMFHPAANAAYDKLSNGWSSVIQLRNLIANAALAKKLTATPLP